MITMLSLETPGMRREIARRLGDAGDLQSIEILMQRLGQESTAGVCDRAGETRG